MYFSLVLANLAESQFHFGSIQTSLVTDGNNVTVSRRLNSTLVQFKLSTRTGTHWLRMQSQFHFGSIQTLLLFDSILELSLIVSIPLWFNSNSLFFYYICMYTQESLNSTLVQFKLYALDKDVKEIVTGLNSTLVQFKQMAPYGR